MCVCVCVCQCKMKRPQTSAASGESLWLAASKLLEIHFTPRARYKRVQAHNESQTRRLVSRLQHQHWFHYAARKTRLDAAACCTAVYCARSCAVSRVSLMDFARVLSARPEYVDPSLDLCYQYKGMQSNFPYRLHNQHCRGAHAPKSPKHVNLFDLGVFSDSEPNCPTNPQS